MFLNLPRDIIIQLPEYLDYEDQVALSLTTKGLRYLAPNESSRGWPGGSCNQVIHRNFLPNAYELNVTDGDRNSSDPENYGQCSYCNHPLCPPTCPTALFLDYETGIFYPASLYPLRTVVPGKGRAAPASTEGFAENSGCHEHFTPGQSEIPWDNNPSSQYRSLRTKHDCGIVYKTIWCEHHRCPSSLINDNFHKENATMGSYRLYRDYHSNSWDNVRKGLLTYICGTTKMEDMNDIYPPPSSSSSGITPKILFPTTEKGFFNQLCPHCRFPMNEKAWSETSCSCSVTEDIEYEDSYGDSSGWACGGSSYRTVYIRECGCEPVHVTFIMCEAFSSIDTSTASGTPTPFYFVLASEAKVKSEIPKGEWRFVDHIKLLQPKEVQRSLEIIRSGGLEEGFEGLKEHPACKMCSGGEPGTVGEG
ncbi:hypothetical protein TWF281_005789 [Arthrobotrys megalospora]